MTLAPARSPIARPTSQFRWTEAARAISSVAPRIIRGNNMPRKSLSLEPLFVKSAAAEKLVLHLFVVGLLLVLAIAGPAQTQPKVQTSARPQPNGDAWKFAVSGDSRNCGDIVMPAIAQGVLHDGAAFYWHLGDYRAIYMIDEDYRQIHPSATMNQYTSDAWADFIQHQMQPFGNLPIFLETGNHEMISPMSRSQYLVQFAKWLDTPVLQRQRMADSPDNRLLETYYHWIDRGVDFISMDNSSSDQFDAEQ